jgi:hypothetical protein
MNSYITELLAEIKRHSICNRLEIVNSKKCGCYSCQTIFAQHEISNWVTETSPNLLERKCLETALCPNCGFDFVIGDAIGVKITEELLSTLDGDEMPNESEILELTLDFKREFDKGYLKPSAEMGLQEGNS